MRQSSKIKVAGAAFMAGSLLLAQGRPAQAQRSESAGDSPRVPGSSANAGQAPNADVQQESRLLLAHGLEMTIEGSTLIGMAQRASGVASGTAVDPRPSTAGVVGSSSVRTPVPVPAVTGAAVPPSTAGTGFTGSAGETVSGRPVGNGNEITPRTPVAGLPEAPQPGIANPPVVAVPAAPLTPGQTGSMLQRQALRAFEAGERLLGAGMTGGGDEAFQQAAERYANSLRTIASQPVIRLGRPDSTTTVRTPVGSVTVTTPPVGGRKAETIGADPASVALVNHAVKEALGAMKIRRMIRQMGGTSGLPGQLLMEHAQMMESESRDTIRAFAGIGDAGPVPRATGELGSPNGTVQALAQQAHDLIMAMGIAPASGPSR